MTGIVGRVHLDPQPVHLDCGCKVVPKVLNAPALGQAGMPHLTGGALVHCPDHNLRHAVEVADVAIVVTYTARRIDPADPERVPLPEEQPHVYTVAAVLHGIATAPCKVCGAGRNGPLHLEGQEATE